jgi:predicted dehydrogenase
MGKRRVRNLMELHAGEILGYDIRADRRKQARELYGIRVDDRFKDALNQKPDAIIISTPPHRHKEYALIAIKNRIPFFTEVNTMRPVEMQYIINGIKKNQLAAMPSANLAYHPSVVRIRNLIDSGSIGNILSFNYHSGSYLPDWHPWEDLKDYYVYKKETGGGRDQIMWELSWIYQIFGKPKTVTGFTKKKGHFDAKIYDVYDLIIEFKSGVIGHIMVDVIQQPLSRFGEIIGTKGTIKWDYEKKSVFVFNSRNNTWKEFPEKLDYKGYKVEKPKKGIIVKDRGMTESYIDEMKDFITMVSSGRKPEFTFMDEKILLEIMYAAEKSSKKGIHVKIK